MEIKYSTITLAEVEETRKQLLKENPEVKQEKRKGEIQRYLLLAVAFFVLEGGIHFLCHHNIAMAVIMYFMAPLAVFGLGLVMKKFFPVDEKVLMQDKTNKEVYDKMEWIVKSLKSQEEIKKYDKAPDVSYNLKGYSLEITSPVKENLFETKSVSLNEREAIRLWDYGVLDFSYLDRAYQKLVETGNYVDPFMKLE